MEGGLLGQELDGGVIYQVNYIFRNVFYPFEHVANGISFAVGEVPLIETMASRKLNKLESKSI